MARLAMVLLIAFGWASPVRANLTQEDVFKSIKENVGEQKDSGGSKALILLACAGGGALLLLVLFSRRRQRAVAPKVFHHHGKLVKEVMRRVSLKPGELRQLRILTDAANSTGAGPVTSPLTLLLCPSLLNKSLQAKPAKVDRKVVGQMVRKLNGP